MVDDSGRIVIACDRIDVAVVASREADEVLEIRLRDAVPVGDSREVEFGVRVGGELVPGLLNVDDNYLCLLVGERIGRNPRRPRRQRAVSSSGSVVVSSVVSEQPATAIVNAAVAA